MGQPVVFLDRDGPINVDHGFVYRIEQWEFSPGALAGMKLLADHGYTLAVVTNQSGIARGFYREADMHLLHDYLKREAKKEGITIAAIAYCPHDRDSTCVCRKPNTGMADQIEQEIGSIDFANSWTIGDKMADVQFGHAKGMRTALLRSKYWNQAGTLVPAPDLIVNSLQDAAQQIVAQAD